MNNIVKFWDDNLVLQHIGVELGWLFNYLDSNNITEVSYIDIGSNVGKFYDVISEKYKINKCVMVEPSKVLFNHMFEKYSNIDGVEMFNCAISDENGDFNFFDSAEMAIEYYEKIGIDNSINLGLSKINKSENGNVKCYSMDFFLKNHNSIPADEITFMKIDTENMDLNIIHSMTQYFIDNKIKPFILFENNYHNTMSKIDAENIITNFCNLCGYELIDLDKPGDNFITPIK
jgi:FkbM family methyltransferase